MPGTIRAIGGKVKIISHQRHYITPLSLKTVETYIWGKREHMGEAKEDRRCAILIQFNRSLKHRFPKRSVQQKPSNGWSQRRHITPLFHSTISISTQLFLARNLITI